MLGDLLYFYPHTKTHHESRALGRLTCALGFMISACGVSSEPAAGSARNDAVVHIETGSARCQSGNTCTYNAWASYVEALHKQATGDTIFVSSDYWSFFRWYEQYRHRALDSTLAPASFDERMNIADGIEILKKYGLVLEQNGESIFQLRAAEAARRLTTEWDSIASIIDEASSALGIDSANPEYTAQREFVQFYTYVSYVWGLGGADGDITAENQALFDTLLCVAAHRAPGRHDLAVGAGLIPFDPNYWDDPGDDGENGENGEDETPQAELVPNCTGVHFLQHEQDPVLQVSGINGAGKRQTVPLRHLLDPEPIPFEVLFAIDPDDFDRGMRSDVSLTDVNYARGSTSSDRAFWRGVQRTLHLGMPILMAFWVEGPLLSSDHTEFTANYAKDPSVKGGYHAVLIVDYEARRGDRTFSLGKLDPDKPCAQDASGAPATPITLDELLDDDVEVTALQVLNSWGPTAHDNGKLRIDTDYLRGAPDDSTAVSPARVVDVLIPRAIHAQAQVR
jgi:hypothetical protein